MRLCIFCSSQHLQACLLIWRIKINHWKVGEVKYISDNVIISKHTLSKSCHQCHSSETAVPVIVKNDNNDSTNGKILLQKIILFSILLRLLMVQSDWMRMQHHKSAGRGRCCGFFKLLISKSTIEIKNKNKFGLGL